MSIRWSSRMRQDRPAPPVVVENGWKVVAALAALGGTVGLLSLAFTDVVRPGASTVAYLVVVSLALALALVISVRRRLGPLVVLLAVLGGDAGYLAVYLCVVDARLDAAPLMLLFPTLVGGLYLTGRGLTAHLLALPVLVAIVLHVEGAPVVPWLVRVTVSTSMLVGAGLIVFLLAGRARTLLSSSQRLVYRDPLSGLLNRRGLDVGSQLLRDRAIEQERKLAAYAIDIDHFKRINDSYGHAAGDNVLSVVAEAIDRSTDPAGLASRVGGEEFVVLDAVTGMDDVTLAANRIRRSVAEAVRDECPQWPVTISIGTAVLDPTRRFTNNEVVRTLIVHADRALYAAKNAGRNRVVHHGDVGGQDQTFPPTR
jgi:diguanylate cyclase (GGDEF)-like protein